MTFTDGPAAGMRAAMKVVPSVVRVLRTVLGKCELVEDKDFAAVYLAPGEELFAYVLAEQLPRITPWIMEAPRPGAQLGWYGQGEYQLLADPPPREVMRVHIQWKAWRMERRQRLQAQSFRKGEDACK